MYADAESMGLQAPRRAAIQSRTGRQVVAMGVAHGTLATRDTKPRMERQEFEDEAA